MKDVVQRALDQGPWQPMVAAMLDDEYSSVFGGASRAVDAAIDTTRLIAHEVRNALVPVRHQIDALVREHGSSERFEASRRGVTRVLDFVDQMVAATELAEEPARAIAIRTIIDEAVLQVSKLRNKYGRVKTGILIATSGFTDELKDARSEWKLGDHPVITIDDHDIEKWIDAEDRVAFLNETKKRSVFE